MDGTQIAFGVVLIIALVGLSAFVIYRQVGVLRGLRLQPDLPPDDRKYIHNQAWRRLVCSGLMLALAVMLGASFFLEDPAAALVAEGQANREKGETRPLDPEQKQFFDLYRYFWGGVLLLLMAIIFLAALDFFAIRRFGLRHYRQIQEGRRTMIQNELARIRSQRNGFH